MAPWCIHISCLERVARSGSGRDSVRGLVGAMDAELSRPDWLATVQSGRKQVQSRVCTPSLKWPFRLSSISFKSFGKSIDLSLDNTCSSFNSSISRNARWSLSSFSVSSDRVRGFSFGPIVRSKSITIETVALTDVERSALRNLVRAIIGVRHQINIFFNHVTILLQLFPRDTLHCHSLLIHASTDCRFYILFDQIRRVLERPTMSRRSHSKRVKWIMMILRGKMGD